MTIVSIVIAAIVVVGGINKSGVDVAYLGG